MMMMMMVVVVVVVVVGSCGDQPTSFFCFLFRVYYLLFRGLLVVYCSNRQQ